MSKDKIIIRGAREHNLKNIDVEIPRDKLVVVTGLSGSGKSSLAFDTIYAEGQRRYVESLSAYARQFLGQMNKPDVDYIEGLSPAISIDQKAASRNPRSTVATVTEIYDYMRLMYARIGIPHCPECGREITQQSVDQIVDKIMDMPEATRIQVLGPVVRGKKGEHKKVLDDLRREGFARVRVNGEARELTDQIDLERYKTHSIEAIVDRLVVRPGIQRRLADSLETALKLGDGLVLVDVVGSGDMVFSEKLACPDCGLSFGELQPRLFSFNSPYGACPGCSGLGVRIEFDPELIFDDGRSIDDGAVLPYNRNGVISDFYTGRIREVSRVKGIDTTVPWSSMPEDAREMLEYGCGEERFRFRYRDSHGREQVWESKFEGVIPNLKRRYRETTSDYIREDLERFMSSSPCAQCHGARLKPEALAVSVGGKSIAEVAAMSTADALVFFESLGRRLTERETLIARQVLKEIRARLGFLSNVGLDYLTLDREAGSLSGGEAQRIRLATQIGSSLVGVLYILDEPSIGLHQRDNARLIATLKELRDLGNTLIVVEHDEETIRSADYVIDIGPGAGAHGGEVIAAGTVGEVESNPASITGQYLSGARSIPVPPVRREPNGKSVVIKGAREHNLKNLDVSIPLGLFVCVTGVSGSGKSTLINEILHARLARDLNRAYARPGAHDSILGTEYLDKVIGIDQSPIGRTPRSNPATYTGVFDLIRDVYARTTEARAKGYRPGRFSFNVKGGRCEACRGDGIIKIEMHFLPDVYVPCEVCRGARYNRETLDVKYKSKSIADVLAMKVEEALEFFSNIPRIQRKLQTLYDVGLGYIQLGQPATTLSGGEAQRVKLATELSRRTNGKTLYILDEPTTGLHFADVGKLLEVLQKLVDGGDTVLVIEHNLDVIKTADYIIDLGPEGGDKGGRLVAEGTPEQVAAMPASYTGQFLARILRAEAKSEHGLEAMTGVVG
ncbi:MAG: UvrABC system protein A [Firmicutes bacterium ADurb.BinA052]|nr:MAG: UvrABC system protein A [Firmicutes bacterium ADurb.BinA052]